MPSVPAMLTVDAQLVDRVDKLLMHFWGPNHTGLLGAMLSLIVVTVSALQGSGWWVTCLRMLYSSSSREQQAAGQAVRAPCRACRPARAGRANHRQSHMSSQAGFWSGMQRLGCSCGTGASPSWLPLSLYRPRPHRDARSRVDCMRAAGGAAAVVRTCAATHPLTAGTEHAHAASPVVIMRPMQPSELDLDSRTALAAP